DIDYFPLARLFGHREKPLATIDPNRLGLTNDILYSDFLSVNPRMFSELEQAVATADGIVLSSPVYFGDRSSVANKLFQISGRENWLKSKVFGMLICGAKRNGGQETTNVFALTEALSQGAL